MCESTDLSTDLCGPEKILVGPRYCSSRGDYKFKLEEFSAKARRGIKPTSLKSKSLFTGPSESFFYEANMLVKEILMHQ